MFSELLLAPDPAADVRPTLADEGTVTAAEVTTWENAPSRTVLSRAENESPTATTGESLLGLSWALDVVGCPTLVISRWRAESLATPGLMAAMYRRLRTPAAAKRTPLTTAEALRQAQLTVLRSPARREPWFWAGFLTLGAVGR
jgi:CHAT domain-containing protein